MTKSGVSIVGALFIIFGALLSTNLVTLATVIYDIAPPRIVWCVPGGNLDTPMLLVSSQTMDISTFTYDDVDPIDKIIATVTISQHSGQSYGPETLTLSYSMSLGYHIRSGWVVPALSLDTVLKFVFTSKDAAGNSASKTSYGIIGKPFAGDFYINNQKVTSTTVIYVSSPTLAFKISMIQGALIVNGLKIEVSKIDLSGSSSLVKTITKSDMSQSGDDYTSSYSLPSQGRFVVTAGVADSTNWYTLAVVGISFGAVGDVLTQYRNQMVGVPLMLAGVILMARPRRRR